MRVTTGLGAALNTAQVRAGSSVAVFGCGGVGPSIIQGAHIARARMIIGVDTHETKGPMVEAANGTHFIDASEQDPLKAIKDLTAGRGVDYAFEAIGLPQLALQCVESLDAVGNRDGGWRPAPSTIYHYDVAT